jgi:hypothetical protein
MHSASWLRLGGVDELALVGCALVGLLTALEAVLASPVVIQGQNSHHLEYARGLTVAEVSSRRSAATVAASA